MMAPGSKMIKSQGRVLTQMRRLFVAVLVKFAVGVVVLLGPLASPTVQATSVAAPLAGDTDAITVETPIAATISDLIERQTLLAEQRSGAALDTSLVPLPADQGELTFEGEYAAREWPLAISAAMAAAPAEFVVAMESAVSVMPETSTLSLEINDRLVGTLALGGRHDGLPHRIAIPGGLLAPGINAVRLTLHQRHRVDCSLKATYELWTRIDPERTGLRAQKALGAMTSLDDLHTVHRAPEGRLPLRLVLPNGASEDMVEAAFHVAQRLALAANARHPIVSIAAESKPGPGIEVLLGAPGEIAAGLGPNAGAIHVPMGLLVRQGERYGSAQVLLGYANLQGLTKLIDAMDLWLAERRLTASAAGARALHLVRGTDVESKRTYTFAELGVYAGGPARDFAGRLARHAFRINLPSDFFAAGYGDMVFRLNGAYAPGLEALNSISVRINGVEAASVRLAKGTRGAVFSNRQIKVPLSAFRPGANRIEIETQLAAAADRGCDVDVLLGTDSRFLLMESSTLRVPGLARLGRLPDLGSLANDGYPYSWSDEVPQIFVPRPDASSIRAAATWVTRLAVAKGAPLNLDLALRPPDKNAGDALIFAAVDDLPASVFAQSQLGRRLLQRELRTGEGALSKVGTAKTGSAQQRLSSPIPALVSVRPGRGLDGIGVTDRESRFADKIAASDSAWAHPLSEIRRILERTIGLTVDELGLPLGRDTAFHLKAEADLFVFQSEAAEHKGRLWTVVTAANPRMLAGAVERLSEPTIWPQLTGRAAALYQDGSLLISEAGGNDQFYSLAAPLSLTNVRLIMAGWFSGNVLIYAGLLLATCLCVGVITDRVLKRVGVTDDVC